jgi:glycosyl transferase family 25
MTNQIPIFVINLDDAADRYDRVSNRLTALGLEFERVPAIRGSTLSASDKSKINPRRFWRYGRTDAEIGCYLSHLKALRLVVERRLPRAIILEDDVEFERDFVLFTSTAFRLPEKTDVLKLEGFGESRRRKVLPVVDLGSRTISFLSDPTFGSAAYLITLSGAEKALRKLRHMKDQLDSDLFRYWQTGIRSYDVLPYPVRQDRVDSTILDRGRVSSELTPAQKALMRLYRRPLKEMDKLKRAYFNVRYHGLSIRFR